jgi:DNA-binding NarL/FixJ family response regulator
MAVIHAPQPLPPHAPVPVVPAAPPIELLLVEPQFLLRRTVAAVARDMRLANPKEITTIEQADSLLATQAFDALFLSLDEESAALELMSRVRNGDTRCAPDVPIAVTAAACDTALALRLKHLDVRRLILRPFKVKGVLDAIAALRQPQPEIHKAA